MTDRLFAPRAQRELRSAAVWIAEDNPDAAEILLDTALRAARLIVAKPGLARIRADCAPPRYRFWSLRGFPWLLVVDTGHEPPVIARFVHQARDLPVVLADLEP